MGFGSRSVDALSHEKITPSGDGVLMGWLMGILKMFFSVILDKHVEEIKKPDEAHFVGGDEELNDSVTDNITDQLMGDETIKKKDMDHG